jgi:sugar (pentulose or hexulose) kinase
MDPSCLTWYGLGSTAALGCAIIAGCAVGAFSNMAEAAILFAKTTESREPNRTQHEHYGKYKEAYARIFDQLHDTFDTMATLRDG